MFKARLKGALSDLVQWKLPQSMAEAWNEMSFKISSNPIFSMTDSVKERRCRKMFPPQFDYPRKKGHGCSYEQFPTDGSRNTEGMAVLGASVRFVSQMEILLYQWIQLEADCVRFRQAESWVLFLGHSNPRQSHRL